MRLPKALRRRPATPAMSAATVFVAPDVERVTATAPPALNVVTRGADGTPELRGRGVPGYGEPDRGSVAGAPYPASAGDETPRRGFADMRYRNARSSGYQLADVWVVRRGPDGQVWIDGHPYDGQPPRQRCPQCLQARTDYPGHLCLQADGAEMWRDWP